MRELLESTHRFPGAYTIKAIGQAEEGFVDRIVAAAQQGLERASDVQFSVRSTPQGAHVAVTLELSVLSADEVIAVYQALREVKGLKLLL